jgi:hypothetical protein
MCWVHIIRNDSTIINIQNNRQRKCDLNLPVVSRTCACISEQFSGKYHTPCPATSSAMNIRKYIQLEDVRKPGDAERSATMQSNKIEEVNLEVRENIYTHFNIYTYFTLNER